jgi:DNA-binding transcriptional LysR family regulator
MSAADGFEEFVAIVDAGSLTAAAAMLDLPRATLSRRLARLEERLGVRLLHRTTRRMDLTQQGEVLYRTARRVVGSAREVEAAVTRLDGVPRGLLRLSVPTGVPREFFGGVLVDFLASHPEVSVEVVTSSVHLDLVTEGFDLALRFGVIKDASLVARTLARNDLIAMASPSYLAARGTPRRPEQLASHNCIVGYTAEGAPELRWPLRAGGWVEVAGSLKTNQMDLRVEAAKRSLGIALLVERVAADELACGELVPVLPDRVGHEVRACLVYPDREFLDPKVRAFIDFFTSRLDARRADA